MFEEQPGSATLKAIESLSTGASSRVALLQSQSSHPVNMKGVDVVFDVDSMIEEAEEIQKNPFSNDEDFETFVRF